MVPIVKNADILALYEKQGAAFERRTITGSADENQVVKPVQQIFSYPAKDIQLVDGRYRAVHPEK